MAANVGTAPVQFFQGANPVSAFLGATPIARTCYFTGAVDGEWTELGNWSTGSLPTAGDSVIATASIQFNSGSEPTVVNFTLNDPNFDALANFINITVTGMATFNDSSYNNGTVTGNLTLNDSSSNNGTVTGTITDNT